MNNVCKPKVIPSRSETRAPRLGFPKIEANGVSSLRFEEQTFRLGAFDERAKGRMEESNHVGSRRWRDTADTRDIEWSLALAWPEEAKGLQGPGDPLDQLVLVPPDGGV